MRFYNRESEIEFLQKIEENSKTTAQFTILLGRRRIGKTALLKKVFSGEKELYFFIEKKNEALLCEEFVEQIKKTLGITIHGQLSTFKQVFSFLMDLSQKEHFTLIIDEFQDFEKINKSIYSEMQHVWDSYKDNSKINLICCGSVYSLMKKIFENYKEPLFGRATAKLHLKTFNTTTLKEILSDYNPKYSNEDLLAFYLFTGGVAKYVEFLVSQKAFTKKQILQAAFSENSLFITEGKDVLIDEFGSDYANYFSILSLIASSKTERSTIETILNMEVGGYLDRLEKDFNLIRRVRPFGAKEGSRNVRYAIEDNFLTFWFRFIYKYRSAIEIGNFDYVRTIAERDYETFSGLILEKYFRAKLVESKQFSDIGNYWNRKGENEIDIIAVNDFEKIINFYEVKRHKKRISLSTLEEKSKEIVKQYSDYTVEYKGLSLENM